MSFVAQITADISNFDKNIKKATDIADSSTKKMQASFDKLGDSFIKIGKGASIFSGAVLAGTTAIAMFAKKTGDMANDLLSATVALDSSADMLQEYKLISIEAGTNTEAFSSAVEALTRRLKEVGGEGDDTTEYIDKLGVSLLDTSGQMRRTGDITNDIIKSLASMENVSQRNVIASQLFGRQWVSIAPILGLGADGIEQVRAKSHELGVVLSGEALDAANKFSISMNVINLRLTAVKDNLASKLAPLLSETIVPIIENRVIPALTDFGEKLGDVVDSFNALPQPTKEFILGVTGIAVAAGPVLIALGGILKVLPLIKTAILALTGPIGIAVTAIVAGATLIITHWDEIKTASRNVVKYVKDDWERLKESFKVTNSSIGKLMKGDFNGWMDDIKKSFNLTVDYLKNRWEQLKGIFKDDKIGNPDQKGLEAALAANEMTGSMGAVKKAVEETVQPTIDLGKANDDLAKSQEKVVESLKAMKLVIPKKEEYSLFDALFTQIGNELILNPTIEPRIDPSELKSKMYETVKSAMGDLSEGIEVISIDLTDMLTSTLTNVFSAVSTAIMEGDNIIGALGASLLGTLGGIMVDLGQMVIATGSAIETVKAALIGLGGLGAIAAGAALIAIGSLFSAGARKLGSSMGGGGGYSSAPSLKNTSPSYAPSEYRGAYRDDFVVTFVQKGDELVGVLDTAQQRRNRL